MSPPSLCLDNVQAAVKPASLLLTKLFCHLVEALVNHLQTIFSLLDDPANRAFNFLKITFFYCCLKQHTSVSGSVVTGLTVLIHILLQSPSFVVFFFLFFCFMSFEVFLDIFLARFLYPGMYFVDYILEVIPTTVITVFKAYVPVSEPVCTLSLLLCSLLISPIRLKKLKKRPEDSVLIHVVLGGGFPLFLCMWTSVGSSDVPS